MRNPLRGLSGHGFSPKERRAKSERELISSLGKSACDESPILTLFNKYLNFSSMVASESEGSKTISYIFSSHKKEKYEKSYL